MNENIVNEKISYWQDIWSHLIDNFNKNSFGLELANPHLILLDIIDEIKYNQFRNKLNKKYFYTQLKYFFENDQVIANYYKSDFIVLKRDFDKSDNKYIQNLCVEILKNFKNGDYFNKSFQYLHDILLNPSWRDGDEDKINDISQSLVVEFIIKGFSLQITGKFVLNIFDNYSFTNKGIIYSNFPHNIDSKTFYVKGNFDRESYSEAVKEKIDSLNISDRLVGIKSYFDQDHKECFFIYNISGLKGDIDITLGDVNFYSPNVKKYIKRSLFGTLITEEATKIEGEACLLNCAVRMKHLDTEITKLEAMEKIEKALSLINLYFPTKEKIQILTEKYFIVDLEGVEIGRGHSTKKSTLYKWETSLELNPNVLEDVFEKRLIGAESDFIFTPSYKRNEIEKKITNSVMWYRKAKETNRDEDKLLNYWISIENIMNFKNDNNSNTFKNAKKYLPFLRVYDFARRLGWDLYDFIWSKSRNKENIPHEILEKCNLNTDTGLIHIKPLIQNLELLENAVNTKSIIGKIKSVRRFYNDNKYAKEKIEQQIQKVENDVILIYRLRNQIVHDAEFNSQVLPYYIQKAEELAKDLLKEIIHKYKVENIDNIEDILIYYKIRLNRTLLKLEQDDSYSLIDDEFLL